MLVGIQMARHHEEREQELPNVGVVPIVRPRPRLHQEASHRRQVAFVLIEPGGDRASIRGAGGSVHGVMVGSAT